MPRELIYAIISAVLMVGSAIIHGGRVLTVVGRGADFAEAISRAYTGVLHIRFEGMQYRRDIGQRALARMRQSG